MRFGVTGITVAVRQVSRVTDASELNPNLLSIPHRNASCIIL
jgi:hypothetical protein